jgi:hypothetical protein
MSEELKAHAVYAILKRWDQDNDYSLGMVVDDLRAALAPPAPAGWKLVPIEPTEEMWTAGRGFDFGPGNGSAEDVSAERVWAAMLAAAPLPSGQQEGGKR